MFSGCTSLVGGDGTKYNSNYMDKTKAYAGQGGYLTLKDGGTKEAYAVLSTDQTTLSFYYDTNKSSRPPVWCTLQQTFVKVLVQYGGLTGV